MATPAAAAHSTLFANTLNRRQMHRAIDSSATQLFVSCRQSIRAARSIASRADRAWPLRECRSHSSCRFARSQRARFASASPSRRLISSGGRGENQLADPLDLQSESSCQRAGGRKGKEMSLRGQAAIVGIGEVPTRRDYPNRTTVGLMAEAAGAGASGRPSHQSRHRRSDYERRRRADADFAGGVYGPPPFIY